MLDGRVAGKMIHLRGYKPSCNINPFRPNEIWHMKHACGY